MATAQRRSRLALIQQLLAQPQRFEFFQATRLLENTAAHAGKTREQTRTLHFRGSHALHFSGADIDAIDALPETEIQRNPGWSMRVNLLSLTGSGGVLPHHYTETLLRRLRARDETLRDFFDLFNDRSIELFFQAWRKYRLPMVYESHRLRQRRGSDPITQALSAIVGLGTPQLGERLPFDSEAVIGFGGVFARLIKSAVGLENILRHYLQLDIKVEQFQGQWLELPADLRSRLPGNGLGGMNNQLGVNTIVGAHCWQIQSKFRVRLRHLTYAQLMQLAPGSARMHNLKTLTQLVAGTELDFDIVLETEREDLPPMRLGGGPTQGGPANNAATPFQPLLGWNTCLHGSRRRQGPVDVVVSQSL